MNLATGLFFFSIILFLFFFERAVNKTKTDFPLCVCLCFQLK